MYLSVVSILQYQFPAEFYQCQGHTATRSKIILLIDQFLCLNRNRKDGGSSDVISIWYDFKKYWSNNSNLLQCIWVYIYVCFEKYGIGISFSILHKT